MKRSGAPGSAWQTTLARRQFLKAGAIIGTSCAAARLAGGLPALGADLIELPFENGERRRFQLTRTSSTYNYLVVKARNDRVRRLPRTMSPEALEMIAVRFRAMGEPLRLRILQELEGGERTVSTLAQSVASTQPNVSKHLRVLQDAGLVERRQQGTSAYYSIADEMVFELCEMICTRLRDRLEAQVGVLDARVRA